VIQDTGFARTLPVGEGILLFNTIEEAADAILEVEANYHRHTEAAREIGKEHFDSKKVLTQLIEQAMSNNE
jgi:branched-subunit amino acid aminotransferase/4-amino-4-deoxychorismate lyase